MNGEQCIKITYHYVHTHRGKANTLLKIQIKALNFSSSFSEDI